MSETTFTSAYDRRLELVEDVVAERTKLGGKAARDLVVHVVSELDHIPERVR